MIEIVTIEAPLFGWASTKREGIAEEDYQKD